MSQQASVTETDSQSVTATIVPEDSTGAPTSLPPGAVVTWVSSDGPLLSVTPSADGLSAVCTAKGGAGVVTVAVTAKDSTGSVLATALGTITITSQAVTQLSISFGTPA